MIRTESRRIIEGTVNVNVGDHNPVKIFIGAITICLLAYWYFSGVFTGLFNSTYCSINGCDPAEVSPDGMESASYFIFQLISGACWLVGSGVIFVWSGLVYVVDDILQGFRKVRAVREQRDAVVDEVTQQVTRDALDPGAEDPFTYLNDKINRRVDSDKLQPVLTDIHSRLDVLEENAGIEKPVPYEEPTISSLAEQIKLLQDQLLDQESKGDKTNA